jgi:hypothetical protein
LSGDAATAIGVAANIATLLAAIVVPTALGVRRRYQRTIGSRRKLVSQIDKLSCNVQTAYVDDLFGQPLFIRKSKQATERIYLTSHAYVQVVVDDSDSVIWWAVTTTDKHFKPQFFLPPMRLDDNGWNVELNKSHFADLESMPLGVRWEVGARRFRFVESYYFGNPGHYQRYLVGYNDAGVGAVHVDDKRPRINYGDLVPRAEESTPPAQQPFFKDYSSDFLPERSGTVVKHLWRYEVFMWGCRKRITAAMGAWSGRRLHSSYKLHSRKVTHMVADQPQPTVYLAYAATVATDEEGRASHTW